MPTYMTQFSYQPKAIAKMIQNPEQRTDAVKNHLDQIGGKIISFYFTFGEYHGICIYEAPEAIDALSIMAACGGADYLSDYKTTTLFSPEEGIEAFKRAGSINITPPKG